MIKKTRYFSYFNKELPKGCQLCVKGQKLVLFVTGICQRSCFYCSISDKKFHKDVVYANEMPAGKKADIIKEAKINSAKGAGFTGGDPLKKFNRTIDYIKILKRQFGKKFHIHLYTIPESITENRLKLLFQAGLDEIRIHPNLKDDTSWANIKLLKKYSWDYGIEIPAIPGFYKETIKLIKYAKDDIQFLNINELEIADNSQNMLNKMGYFTKDDLSYGIKGSEKTALKILNFCDKNTGLKLHYCTSRLKDKVQLTERIRLRAKNIANRFDKINTQGILERYAVYLPESKPGEKIPKKRRMTMLKKLNSRLKKSGINDIIFDKQNIRAFLSKEVIIKSKKILISNNLIPAKLFEYPTFDSMIVELEFLI